MKMMKSLAALLLLAVVGCNANPMPQDGKFGAEFGQSYGQKPNLNIYGNHGWESDRGKFGISGNHEREMGGLGRHQTNANIGGSYDVFKSDDGKTTGSVFGSAGQQWNSHGPNSKNYEWGGRIERTWGRK